MIYFIRCGAKGPIKIGFSASNPLARLGSMQTAHHVTLTLVACMEGTGADEKSLHARFKHLRLRGEWFRPQPDLVAFIHETEKIDTASLRPVKPEPPPIDYRALRREAEAIEAEAQRKRAERRQRRVAEMRILNEKHNRRTASRQVPFLEPNVRFAAYADR